MVWRRRLRQLGFFATVCAVMLVSSGLGLGCALSAPGWRGPVSDHFDGTHFFVKGAPEMKGVSDAVTWASTRHPGPWSAYRDVPPGPPPPREVGPGKMRVTFINHATTLVQLDDVNVLTDPIYSKRCSPVDFAGPKRVRPPGIRFEDLPRIDVVVVSHNHYDHLDLPTLERIQAAFPNVRFFVGLGNKALLTAQKLDDVEELDWWQSREGEGRDGDERADAALRQPRALRSPEDPVDGLGAGGHHGRAYFGGDTGYGPHFLAAALRLGAFRLAVLPIGAYEPEWFMGPIHMSPKDAVKAANDLRATLAVPMHFGTFPLGDDGEHEAVDALKKALVATPAPFRVLDFGEGVDVPELVP